MDLKYRFTIGDIRIIEHYLPVEASGPQKRRIEYIRTVSSGHDDNISIRIETVHFHQDLVQRLLAFVVRTAQAGTALAADRLDLVYEYYAGCVLFRFLK